MVAFQSVLLIEDSPAARFLHASLIEEVNLTKNLYMAANGRDGLALFEKKAKAGIPPEIVLLDLKMPVMDGFDFLEAYKRKGYYHKYPTIIGVLTSSSNPRDIWQLQQIGIARYIPKPLILDDLKRLTELFHGRNARMGT
jgi:CheY-like chemotaxis protein